MRSAEATVPVVPRYQVATCMVRARSALDADTETRAPHHRMKWETEGVFICHHLSPLSREAGGQSTKDWMPLRGHERVTGLCNK